MAVNQPAMNDDEPPLTPEDVRRMATDYREKHLDEAGTSLFVELFTPRARAQILDVLLANPTEAMSAAKIAERADVSRSSFARQADALLDLGVMVRHEQVGNAWTYRLNTDHPAAQLAGMLDQVLGYGTAAMLLDEQFIGTPGADYEPGEHPADDR